MSSVITPPWVKNSRSASSASSACSKELATVGIAAASSGGKSYRSLSAASPGWILFLIPSRPAINNAVNARYGLAVGSGKRTSIRRARSLVTNGIRIDAERLRAEYASITGASNPGTRRL